METTVDIHQWVFPVLGWCPLLIWGIIKGPARLSSELIKVGSPDGSVLIWTQLGPECFGEAAYVMWAAGQRRCHGAPEVRRSSVS